MKPIPLDWEPFVCSVDPISLTALAVAGIAGVAGGAIASSTSSSSAPATQAAPTAAPAQAAPAAPPATERPKPKSNTPSFIGGSAVPDSRSFGTKTLLGQ